eukprot:gene20006-30789_t
MGKAPHPALKGQRVVFTGALPIVRAQASALAIEMGATVQNSVSGSTTVLVTASKDMQTTKMHSAKMNHLEIWTGDKFMKVVSEWQSGSIKTAPKAKPKAAASKGNTKKKKKRSESSEESDGSCDGSSSSSSSSSAPKKKKQKKSSAKAPAAADTDGYDDVTLYHGKGGCKKAIARKLGVLVTADKPPFVEPEELTARHINLAPEDITPPLNTVIETPDLSSPAFAVMAAFAVHPRYHDLATVDPLTEDNAGEHRSIWKALKSTKDPFKVSFDPENDED